MRTPAGRRAVGIAAALLLEALLVLLLLSLGDSKASKGSEEALVSFTAASEAEPAPEPAETTQAEPQANAEKPAPPTPVDTPQPVAQPVPVAPPIIPVVREPAAPVAPPVVRRPPPPADGPVYGPVDTGSAASSGDSARVGTAPNGEPLYAARWYREPYEDELRGYLSTATGPGWGLIACKTAPDYRVEDCVALDESPRGSLINRAVLAAAWQFKVRPPRLGGRSLVGAWVRIRIDYNLRAASR